jgi:DNA topoisomerase VI subunit B
MTTSAAPTLARTTFTSSRLMEFFTEKELQMQIGYGPRLWLVALVKELIDNALDACENAGIAPEISIAVEPDGVSVSDNGPGLPVATLQRSLDYLTRTSDKAHYVSPTRGQLGNALKCVWAAPFVVDGQAGHVEVITGGERYSVDVRLDRLAQAPRLDLASTPAPDVKIGTIVRMAWPGAASLLTDVGQPDFYNVATVARNFVLFNPHLTLTLTTLDNSEHWDRTCDDWGKWTPSQPTDPHWYSAERLGQLIAAYVVADGESRNRSVREFVSEFAGLSGTGKQKAVCASCGLSGATLRDLTRNGDLDRGRIAGLLHAMQERARAVKPAALGAISQVHLTSRIVELLDAEPETIRYSKQEGVAGGVPFLVETAFGIHRESREYRGRDLAFGVNWSAILQSPLVNLTSLLGAVRIDAHDPVSLVVHLISPRIEFTDRGKTMLGLLS